MSANISKIKNLAKVYYIIVIIQLLIKDNGNIIYPMVKEFLTILLEERPTENLNKVSIFFYCQIKCE
jgi:hypothetical protein